MAARTRLAEPCSAGNKKAWATLVAKFPPGDHTSIVSATTAAVELSSATGVEDGGSSPPWYPDNEYTPQARFDIISFRSVHRTSNDSRTSSPSPTTTVSGGRAGFVRGMKPVLEETASTSRVASLLEFWQFYLHTSPTALGGEVSSGLAWAGVGCGSSPRREL